MSCFTLNERVKTTERFLALIYNNIDQCQRVSSDPSFITVDYRLYYLSMLIIQCTSKEIVFISKSLFRTLLKRKTVECLQYVSIK